MTQLRDTAAIFRFHKSLLEEYGDNSAKALGWVSSEAQLARFEVIKELADFNYQSILDVGCGFGDLRAYLGNYYPHLRYFGIEQIPVLLDVAAARYARLPETIFYRGTLQKLICLLQIILSLTVLSIIKTVTLLLFLRSFINFLIIAEKVLYLTCLVIRLPIVS